MRWCGIGAVNDGEVVITRSGGQLRQQHDVAQLDARQRQPSLVVGEVVARERAVECNYLLHPLRRYCFSGPRGVLLGGDERRLAFFQEFGLGAVGIVVENGPLLLDEGCQPLGRRGETLHAVTLAAEPHEQVVERWRDLHAGGRQDILPGALVVVDCYALLAVGHALQGDVAIHRLDEPVQSFGNGMDLLQPFAVEAVTEQHLGADRSVDLGHHYTLRQETAVHAHLVGLPFVDHPVDVQRREERNVLARQVLHNGIAQASVGHVDDGRRTDRIGLSALNRRRQVTERIDRVAGLLEPGD